MGRGFTTSKLLSTLHDERGMRGDQTPIITYPLV
jgi:hypothetical protein